MAFDIEGAKQAGYNDAEIADHLAKQSNFDLAGAKKAGYNDAEILQHLTGPPGVKGETVPEDGPRPLTIRRGEPRAVAPTEMPQAEPDTSLTQNAGVLARTLAPYATAAGAGALMGAPLGGVGAIPGAIAGVGALGLGNLATGAYNLAAPMFGGSQIANPSEAIRNAFAAGGVGRKPATSEQAMAAAAMEGGLDALSLAGAGRTLGGKIGNFFAAKPAVQATGGVGAAATPVAMQEYYGVEDPYALAAGSLIGGIASARTGANVAESATRLRDLAKRYVEKSNISSEALKQRAQAGFNATDASGVVYDSAALNSFGTKTRQDLARKQYKPTSPRLTYVNDALAKVDEAAANSQSIGNLHSLREDLGFYRESAYTAKRPDAARMITQIINNLDDFIAAPKNATFAAGADVVEASKTLKSSITDWSRLANSNKIDSAISRASLSDRPFADALQSEFKTMVKNPARLARFGKEEQAAIRALASGQNESSTLKLLSQLSPSFNRRDIVRTGAAGLGVGAGLYASSLPLAATAAGLSVAGLGARAARNALAGVEANALAAAMRRGDVRAPMNVTTQEMLRRVPPQMLMQDQQSNSMAR